MGTMGCRVGYKIFSINTTIRNPARNYDFLFVLQKYDGFENTNSNLHLYYFDLIKRGIYQSINVPNNVKTLWENDIPLNEEQIRSIIADNPQATGMKGRVMTQLRALKDQSLVKFVDTDRPSIKRIYISKFGKELLAHPEKAQNIYTKIMLSMHANNPCRPLMLNESIPFLNTIFVIAEVNRIWKELGNEPKGILMHEFGAFVLSMKDCDYRQAARDIVSYRNKFRYEINRDFITQYLKNKDIIPFAFNSIIHDYPDEVFRKFEMTGLLTHRGKHAYVYIDFSNYNLEKVNVILKEYRDYSFKHFDSAEDYYAFQENTYVPWEDDDLVRRQIVNYKARALSIPLDPQLPLDEKEAYLDSLFYSSALSKAVQQIDLKQIIKELLILSGTCREKSKYDSLPEPLRLEYLLALLIGKKFGTKGLVSNIIYSEDGLPLHCAAGGKYDLSYHDARGSYILEPTMISNKNQMLNSETTNIVRHAREAENTTGIAYRVLMIAPRAHSDVVDFFRYQIFRCNARIIMVTIDKAVELIATSPNIDALNNKYDVQRTLLNNDAPDVYADEINRFRYALSDWLS